MKNSICILLFTSVVALCNSETLPVLMWGTEDSVYVPALETLESSAFGSFITNQEKVDAVTVVYYENNLSNEDITLCKLSDGTTCYKYLQSLKSLTYIPSVENPLQTLQSLDQSNEIFADLNPDGSVNVKKSNIVSGATIFVSLAEENFYEERDAILIKHDETIRQFSEFLSELGFNKVIGIYTGNHPTIEHSINKRQAGEQQNNATVNPKFFSLSNKVLIYFTDLQYLMADGKWQSVDVTIAELTAQTDTSMTVQLSGGDHKLSFDLTSKYGNWDLENPKWDGSDFETNPAISINAPFSYHCGPGILFRARNTSLQILWSGLQLQPNFDNSTTVKFVAFGDSWDCIGFTSPIIWSAIFVSFLIILILSIGFGWLYDIKTMDRFDDPKGKTITVTEAE